MYDRLCGKGRCMAAFITFYVIVFFINVTFTFFQSKGQTLKEAVYINRSLSFLEQTIVALADRRREHVPFRQSKLTHALKDSLGETARLFFCLLC